MHDCPLSVCACLSQVSILSKGMDGSSWILALRLCPATYPVLSLYYKDIQVSGLAYRMWPCVIFSYCTVGCRVSVEMVIVVVLMLQLNEDDADNLADDVNADNCGEQPAEKVTVSPAKTKKKRKKKAKDKSSSDAKALVFCSLLAKSETVYFIPF